MSSIYVEIIGLSAGFITMIGFVPQLYKIWRHGSSSGVSLQMYFVLLIGVTLWFIYGLLIGSVSIIISNMIAGILQISIIVLVLKNHRKKT